MNQRDFSNRDAGCEFAINKFIVKSCGCGVMPRSGKPDALDPAPINCAETHRAGFAACVDLAAVQFVVADLLAGSSNCDHLGVRGRIVGGSYVIYSFGNQFAVANNQRTKRAAVSSTDILGSDLNRPVKPILFQAIRAFPGVRTLQLYSPSRLARVDFAPCQRLLRSGQTSDRPSYAQRHQ